MNRELKFRIWDKKNNMFIYVWDASHKRLAISLNGLVYSGMYDDILPENDYNIQQYTGLKDKNGREIYEGDIVQYYFNNPEVIWVDLVAWESYGWVFLHFDGTESGSTPLFSIPSMEIIGNIFENKELLNL
jgi:uncharacterized phage protein (TIGR01671 family)